MKLNLLYIGTKLLHEGRTSSCIDTLGPRLEEAGYTVFYASAKKNKGLRLLDMVALTYENRNKIDYVLMDTYSTSNFWYAVLISQLCRMLGLPYIPILHGGNLPERLIKNPRISTLIFKYSYKNVAPSPYLLQAFANKGYAEIQLIPNALELANYPLQNRPILRPKLLWLRSLADLYNPEMALRVLAQVQKQQPEASLLMVGPDKENILSALQKLARALEIKVEFTGKLSRTEWVQRARDCDIFINTTHFDNLPVSILEALALGLPIVSTNVGGIPFLLENNTNALLVGDNQVAEMAEAVLALLNNSALKDEQIRQGLQLVKNYDWEIIKVKWIAILLKKE